VAAGDLSARVRPEGAREVVTLGQRFNAMTERLGAAQDALREAEREAAWREVARRLAHEFKNILTPMSLSLHRLRRRTGEVSADHRPAVEESLLALKGGVEQLTRLAEQFSQYARLPEPRFERLDLDQLIRDAVRLHEREEVMLKMEGDGPVWVRGDGLLLARAIHNLVLNACEASPAGGVVEVRSHAEAREAVVLVLDRGPGLSPEVRDRLFEPYVSTKRRGSGLGLSLVRDIAAQHGGTITLEDREGGGARARLALPRADATQDGEPTA
jgi:two-component system nitrogen regulation sensor histidine kinase NtrY